MKHIDTHLLAILSWRTLQRDPGRATEFLLNKNLLVYLCIFKAVPSILEAKEQEGRVFGGDKEHRTIREKQERLID